MNSISKILFMSLTAASLAVLPAVVPVQAAAGAGGRVASQDWNGVHGIAAIGDKAYLTTRDGAFEVDAGGKIRPIAKGFVSNKIAALDGKLYTVTGDGELFELGVDGSRKSLGKDWMGVPAMAGLDGKLYIIDREVMYLTEKDGTYKELTDDWYNVDGMTSMNGKLYVLCRDEVYEVDKQGRRKQLTNYAFSTPRGLTAANGKLYVTADERTPTKPNGVFNESSIFEVDASGAVTRLASPSGWDLTTGAQGLVAIGNSLLIPVTKTMPTSTTLFVVPLG